MHIWPVCSELLSFDSEKYVCETKLLKDFFEGAHLASLLHL